MTDILLRREPKPEQNTYLHAIKEFSNSLLVIINDILDLSKIEAGKIESESIPFSLTEVISNVETILHFRAEERAIAQNGYNRGNKHPGHWRSHKIAPSVTQPHQQRHQVYRERSGNHPAQFTRNRWRSSYG